MAFVLNLLALMVLEYNSDAEGAAGAGHSYADACAAVDAAAKEAAVAGMLTYADVC